MLAEKRREEILKVITERGSATVGELAELFDVVTMTIRRDLEMLEKRNLLTRIHGGAVINPEPLTARPLDAKESINQRAKAAIGRRAVSLVEPGETIILDEGSTCIEVARALRNHHDVTVVTNGVKVAYELTPYSGITTILIGGICGRNNYVAYGHETLTSFQKIRAHKYFMGIDAIQPGFGISDQDPNQVQLKNAKAHSSLEVIGVADNSKLGKIGVVQVAGMDILDRLIMNEPIQDSVRTWLVREQVELIPVEAAENGQRGDGKLG